MPPLEVASLNSLPALDRAAVRSHPADGLDRTTPPTRFLLR